MCGGWWTVGRAWECAYIPGGHADPRGPRGSPTPGRGRPTPWRRGSRKTPPQVSASRKPAAPPALAPPPGTRAACLRHWPATSATARAAYPRHARWSPRPVCAWLLPVCVCFPPRPVGFLRPGGFALAVVPLFFAAPLCAVLPLSSRLLASCSWPSGLLLTSSPLGRPLDFFLTFTIAGMSCGCGVTLRAPCGMICNASSHKHRLTRQPSSWQAG